MAWNIFTLEHGKGMKTLRGLQIQPQQKSQQSADDHLSIVQKWMAGRKAR